ncbi:DNA polymerase, partial [Candidatus Liberibacter sp.]|uniref:DNA polymerase n=1 Tax=Candidatus Liberibacter sp. TaxID=34022 RepID=UPI0015F39DF2
MKKEDHLFLVDGSSFIFRAFYAIPPLHRKSDGLPVNAVSGFCNMLWKLLQNSRSQDVSRKVSHFAVIFDHPEKTFRHDLYPQYKTNRSSAPEMLIPQFPLVRLATQAFGVKSLEMKGFEADDIIATYARSAEKKGVYVTIVTADKDFMQLVSPLICLYDSIKEERIDIDSVIKKWGVPPEKMVCLQALVGDSSDNIPGIPGIGYKTAASLLQEYGDLESILKCANQMTQKKRRESILENADIARLSRDLVKLCTDVPITVPLDHLTLEPQNGSKIIAFLKALECTALTKRVAKACDCDANHIEPAYLEISEKWKKETSIAEKSADLLEEKISENTPHALVVTRSEIVAQSQINNDSSIQIINVTDLRKWVSILKESGTISFKMITDTTDALCSKPIGMAFSILNKDIFPSKLETSTVYIPFSFEDETEENTSPEKQYIPIKIALAHLKACFEDEKILKISHNIKYDFLVMQRYGIMIRSFDDIKLISYVLDSGRSAHNITSLSGKYLSHQLITRKEILGTGKSSIPLNKIPISQIQSYAIENSDVIFRLWLLLKPRLIAEKLLHVYERLEKPIVTVLADMEFEGIHIDKELLSQSSHELGKEIAILEEKIYLESGEKFNINSPKQLGEVLFEQLKLPGGTKTKTGQWKTSAQNLEEIDCEEQRSLVSTILEWRQLSKLKSTYTDSLPHYINNKTQRVHTFYSLASTTTGRLSSSEPNLQN